MEPGRYNAITDIFFPSVVCKREIELVDRERQKNKRQRDSQTHRHRERA